MTKEWLPAPSPRPLPTREERLAAALRENLRRRKAQARLRDDATPVDGAPEGNGGESPPGSSPTGEGRG